MENDDENQYNEDQEEDESEYYSDYDYSESSDMYRSHYKEEEL